MNHSRGRRYSTEIVVNGSLASKDDFDRLIEEQDCFEISLRYEKARNNILMKEIRKVKKDHRKDLLRLEKEVMEQQATISNQEETIKTLEKQMWEQQLELEQFKKPLKMNSIPEKISEVGEINEVHDNEEVKVLQRTQSERRFKKAASLVAQLIQGFEAQAAAVAATNPPPPPTHENVRRRQTVHGYRTVTL